MSAFLLPLHYLTFKVGEVLSVVMLLSYFLPIVLRIGSYERPALASLGKFFLRKIEYSSVKARQKLIARCSQLFFYLQHPIIEPTSKAPALHLVHGPVPGPTHHNIYVARKVSLL